MQDFLNLNGSAEGGATPPHGATPPQDRKVSLRVTLPNHSVCAVSIKDTSKTVDVFEVHNSSSSL